MRDEVAGARISPELKPLLWSVYERIRRDPVDLRDLKESLVQLLEFLASPEGRTDANCTATDSFFCFQRDWEVSTEYLPDEYQDIFGDLGGALHDTVTAPEIAQNFYSTREQLLGRVKELR